MIETLEAVGALSVNGLALLFVCQMMLSIFEARSRLMAKAGGAIRNGTKGFTEGAKSFGENRNFYQRRQFARDARKQEQRRANVEDYAAQITGEGWRSRQLRRRAAGGIVGGQLLNANAAGQERQRLVGMAQLEKFEHEETQQAAGLIEANRITAPGQLQALAAGGVGVGVDGRSTISAQGNRALQRAALQKIIDAQDAEQLENLFMNRVERRDATGNVVGYAQGNVDQTMLVGELQKGKNYSTTKGAGAHLVAMGVKSDGSAYSEAEVQKAAVVALSKLARDKLAQQDGPAWDSALAGLRSGVGDPSTLTARQKLWDVVQEIDSDGRAQALLKGSSKDAYNNILSNPGGRPTV